MSHDLNSAGNCGNTQCPLCFPKAPVSPWPMWSSTPVPAIAAVDFDLAVALRVRAEDKLRAQRKRHAQREAKQKAQLEEAQARLDRAMEIVQYVAVGDHIRDWGADARVTILERINKQAQTLVAQEKVRKQA